MKNVIKRAPSKLACNWPNVNIFCKTMRFLAVLAICLMSMMSVKAQNQRMLGFQVMMSMHDTTYKNLIKDGKYKEAIAPLTTLINILDTTTICQDTEMSPEMIKAAKADYLYDLACCYALTKQKKQALMTLEKSVGLCWLWLRTANHLAFSESRLPSPQIL